jgi:hypothetical protein
MIQKHSSSFEPPKEIADQIYEWAKFEYLRRLIPRTKSRIGYLNRLEKLKSEAIREMQTGSEARKPPYKVFEFNNLLQRSWKNVRRSLAVYRHYKNLIPRIDKLIQKVGPSYDLIYLLEKAEEILHSPTLQTTQSSKLNAETTFKYNGKENDIAIAFGEDENQSSAIYHDSLRIVIYLDKKDFFNISSFGKLLFRFAELRDTIEHELVHLEQQVTRRGYPNIKVREKGVDLDGNKQRNKPSGKVITYHKNETVHALIDAEFWANIRHLSIYWSFILTNTPEEERLERFKELIGESSTIEDMKPNPKKRRLFIKHLVSNVNDLIPNISDLII